MKNYAPSDFGNVSISKLAKNAINYGKHFYQVNLNTQEYHQALNSELLERLGIDEKTMKLEY